MTKTEILSKSRISRLLGTDPSLRIGLLTHRAEKHQNEPYMSHNDFNVALFETYKMLHRVVPSENHYLESAYNVFKRHLEEVA